MTAAETQDDALQNANRRADEARAFDDQQNEVAGRDVGRMARFLGTDAGPEAERKRREKTEQALSALQQLLSSDPAYKALYESVWEKAERISLAATQALSALERNIASALDTLDEIREAAAQLADGTLVFRATDGRILTENGRVLTGEEADGITWPENAPSWEAFQDQAQRCKQRSMLPHRSNWICRRLAPKERKSLRRRVSPKR
ncbi:MAG: hypothetical protein AAF668_06595 [Pseudomonadota bacterium]